ncbi:MAG: hypothetical protein O2895_04610 [Chloroflexi bacterium]|nr:hypothetical protein [Chloroflexota bacterium]
MNLIPDDFKHPSGGERVTGAAEDAIRLAHKALDRFPDVVRRHKFIAGGAAISSSLVALAGVAITRRMRSGQTEEEALASITEEELSGRRVELPHADQPGADQPGADQPDADQPGSGQAHGDGAHATVAEESGAVEAASIGSSEFDAPLEDMDAAPVSGDGAVPVKPRP